MCEVSKSNIEHYLPSIEKAINNAEFIAVDTEFTGLQLNDDSKPSLFDNSEERYRKLKNSVSQFLVCQIGISAFVKQDDENRYIAHSFNFNLFPTAFGPHDVRFQIQASSISFLCRYKFDFQKEEIVREHLDKQSRFSGLEREVDERLLQRICSRIAEEFVRHKEGDTFIVHQDQDSRSFNEYVLHSEIRNRFPGVWTRRDSLGNLVVEVMSPQKREDLEAESYESRRHQEQLLMDTLLGFTRVFRILTDYKKPLIGHNMLMDLMFMYDKFYQPLPNRYQDFKDNLHQLFPRIYDTKHMSCIMRKPLEKTGLLQSTTLEHLYNSLNSDSGKQRVLFSPVIEHAVGFDRYRGQHHLHEAGYDAYLCGCVFLRLAHIIALKDVKSTDVEACPFRQYLFALTSFVNRVNVIRAMMNYIKIDGKDPPSKRPNLLFVKSRRPTYSLSSEQLAQWFSSYGTVDVRLLNRHRALVATGNFICAKDILSSFRKHDKIRVTYYDMWKHSPFVRGVLWTGVAVSSGICLWVLFSGSKPTR